MLPWGAIEQALRLANLLIEATPIEQRRANAIAWFWLWWPAMKAFLSKDQEAQIEGIMNQIPKA